MKQFWLFLITSGFFLSGALAQSGSPLSAYIGGQSRVELYDIFEITAPGSPSDKTILVAGGADNLDWLSASVLPLNQRNQLSMTALQGQNLLSDSGGVGFILQFSPDLKTILHATHFPLGTGTTVSRIRTTTRTGDPMGELYISGKRFVTDSGYTTRQRFRQNQVVPKEEYFIARLNGNFVNQVPTAAVFYVNARCRYDYRNSNIHTQSQPWDVNTRGEVVYGEGATYIPVFNSFCYLRKCDAWGRPMVVPGWMMHVLDNGQVVYGNPAPANTAYSLINGYMGKRGSWRSHTQADYEMAGVDANGNARSGKYPDDFWYKRWVDPLTGVGEPSDLETGPGFTTALSAGPGRTGRVADHPRSYGFGAIVFDKVTNNLYAGFTVGYYWSVPPDTSQKAQWDVRHEFDPQVVAMDTNGFITGWDRMKKEASNDQPDSYLDALDIDYANRMLVVLARQHGNDYNTSWTGNELTANPGAQGFKNGLNGTTGDIHIQWIGKLRLSDFTVYHSTFLAEYPMNTSILTPYTNPKYDGWQNQNANFISLANTRRVNDAPNIFKVGRDGQVAVSTVGSRILTTSDAWQKMLKPPQEAGACGYVRQYSPDLKEVTYSSLITSSPTFSQTVEIYGLLPGKNSLRALGASGALGQIPGTPAAERNWNFTTNSAPTTPAGFLARLPFEETNYPEPTDTLDYPVIPLTPTTANRPVLAVRAVRLWPNPAQDRVHVSGLSEVLSLQLISPLGQQILERTGDGQDATNLDLRNLKPGIYQLRVQWKDRSQGLPIVVKH